MGNMKEPYPMEPGFYLMDCMEGMKHFPDDFFDLAIVDPPYGDGNSEIGGGVHGSGDGSTDTRRWNRFGPRFNRYKSLEPLCGRDNLPKIYHSSQTKAGGKQQKKYSVGRGPRERILSRTFPRLTRSDHLGRELF